VTVRAPAAAIAPPPHPLLLEAAGHTCVAWWHAPAAGAALPLAVVLASSWGDEDMAAYDAQRALAGALAQGGLGTLRFEWPDTGDSSAASGAATIADALDAFEAAARRTLVLSGGERLAFVGHRLGALLAAHAALARQDVDALVALEPVASGLAFVRQQPVADIGPRPGAALRPGSVVDPAQLPVPVGGFALPARRLEALSALRWPTGATTSVLEALLVARPQVRCRAAADALARLGVRVHEAAAGDGGQAAIVDWLRERATDATVLHGVPAIPDFGVADPGNVRVHARLAAARLEAATSAVLALAAAEAPAWMALRERGVALRERVVRLADGRGPALAAVLSERDPAGSGDDMRVARHGLVLLSDGQRRIGPHRLWVPWARHRAARGDVVLRLDVAGSGDSAPAQSAPRQAGEVARAVAWLRRESGAGGCTVVAIGEGAVHAARAAAEGADLQRIVAIDPRALRLPAPPASRARRALRLCARAAAWLLRRPLESDLARAAERGVAVDLLLSGDAPPAAGRRARALLRDGRMTLDHLPHATPGFAATVDREALYARLDALVRPQDAGPAAAASAATAWRADARPTPASEALRLIARASGAAT